MTIYTADNENILHLLVTLRVPVESCVYAILYFKAETSMAKTSETETSAHPCHVTYHTLSHVWSLHSTLIIFCALKCPYVTVYTIHWAGLFDLCTWKVLDTLARVLPYTCIYRVCLYYETVFVSILLPFSHLGITRYYRKLCQKLYQKVFVSSCALTVSTTVRTTVRKSAFLPSRSVSKTI